MLCHDGESVGVFDQLFGKGRDAEKARKAELRGDLTRAIELFIQAGTPADAARVMLLRGDAEPDARARMQHYTQASATAPPGSNENRLARKKRALLVLALAGDAALSAIARRDVLDAAAELEEVGEPQKAAEAYAACGDPEGEARALAAAGDVEGLEYLLATEQHKERGERKRKDRQAEVELLLTSGRRREAQEALDALVRAYPDDAALRERVQGLLGRRARGPLLPMLVHGTRIVAALGAEVIIGRSEGTLLVPSNAVSRRHLSIHRQAGGVFVKDLSSRNGTQLRSLPLRGALPVGAGLELRLGREVPVRIAPSALLPDAVDIEVAGERVTAPLGPIRLGIGDWTLIEAGDGWLELAGRSPEIFMGDISVGTGATLLVGDAFGSERGGAPKLKVLG